MAFHTKPVFQKRGSDFADELRSIYNRSPYRGDDIWVLSDDDLLQEWAAAELYDKDW